MRSLALVATALFLNAPACGGDGEGDSSTSVSASMTLGSEGEAETGGEGDGEAEATSQTGDGDGDAGDGDGGDGDGDGAPGLAGTLFLNFDGAELTGDGEDSRMNQTQIAEMVGTAQAYGGGDEKLFVAQAVKDRLATCRSMSLSNARQAATTT